MTPYKINNNEDVIKSSIDCDKSSIDNISFEMADQDSLRSPTKISLAMTSRQELSGKQSKPKSHSACCKKDKLDFGMSLAEKSNVSIEKVEQIVSKL